VWPSSDAAVSTAESGRPVPDNYAFQALDKRTDRQMDMAEDIGVAMCYSIDKKL